MTDDSLSWTVTDREVAYACPGFEVIREAVTLPNGTETDFDFLVEPPSVVIVPVTTAGEIVVIEEWREAVKRRNRGFPAGSSDPDDADLFETAKRELREETGFVADDLEQFGTFEPANGLAAIEHAYFVARNCTRAGDPEHDPDETIRVETTSWSALRDQALAGEIRDGRTVLGLLYYETQFGAP